MKTSMRKTFATLLLSGTAAFAMPALAQQEPAASGEGNPAIILPEGQGSAQSGTDMNSGAAENNTDANAKAQTPENGGADQNSAQSGGAVTDDEATTAKKDRQTTAEGGQVKSDDAAKTEAQSNTEGEDTQSTAGTNAEESSPSNETTASIDITAEQRTEIRNVIVESDVKPVDVDFEVNVGVAVPRTVELRPLPPRIIKIVPAYRSYEYFLLADGRIVIVEPSTLKIVYVITS